MRSNGTRAIVAAVAVLVLVAVAVVAYWAGQSSRRPVATPPPRVTPSQPLAPTAAPTVPTPSRTRFGAAFQVRRGEGYANALARTDQSLGRLDVVRVFYPGAPAPWPGKAPGRNVVVSFKLDPRAVVTSEFDEQMRTWFRTAPRDLDVNWVYWHEPEDDIEAGRFTAEEFRAAFAHLARLAREANNPRLKSTLVLMSYTTRAASGRNWRDYYPGDDVIDVFAWDVYNRPGRDGEAYSSPAELMDAPRKISESVGKPFAVAELGSVLAPGDDGTGRATWLRTVGEYVKEHNADFLIYFDLSWNGGADDYRLRDAPSRQAWAEARAMQ